MLNRKIKATSDRVEIKLLVIKESQNVENKGAQGLPYTDSPAL